MSIDPKTLSVFTGEAREAIPAQWSHYTEKQDADNVWLHSGCEDQLSAYYAAREEKYFLQDMADMCLTLCAITGVGPERCGEAMTRAENAQFAMDDAWQEFLKCFLAVKA